jgi:hypothetical protein
MFGKATWNDGSCFYTWPQKLNGSPRWYEYIAEVEGDCLTITNNERFDTLQEVVLDTDDQMALLFILADRFGVKIEGA